MEKLNTDLILLDHNYYLKLIKWSQTIERRELKLFLTQFPSINPSRLRFKLQESKEVLPEKTLFLLGIAHITF